MPTIDELLKGDADNAILRLHSFSGFYQSIHDDQINQALDGLFQDDRGESHTPDAFHGAFSLTHELMSDYCKVYIEALKTYFKEEHDLDLPSMQFKHISSPREYNFETDKLFVTLGANDFNKLGELMRYDEATIASFRNKLEEQLTPRDGFIPFYSNDADEWLKEPFSHWDPVQKGMMLEAITGGWDDLEVIQGADLMHEKLDTIINDHLEGDALKLVQAWERKRDQGHSPDSPSP